MQNNDEQIRAMVDAELLPCPFCGGKAFLHHNDVADYWYVSCNECINQTGHFFNGKDIVIGRWNTRALAAAYEADRERLAVAVEALGRWRCQNCRGKGERDYSCTLCGDSTYDHYCNDKTVECVDCKGTGKDPAATEALGLIAGGEGER